MLSFLDPVVRIAQHAISLLFQLLEPLVPVAAAGLAVVVFTMLIRLALHPLARAQARGEKARGALAPRIRELQTKHKGDRQALSEATMSLYREHGSSPLAGCGPTLLQLPVFSVLYRLFSIPTIGGTPNALLHHTFFGTALGTHFANSPGDPVFWFLLAGLAVTATFSARYSARRMAANPAPPSEGAGPDLGALSAKLARFMPYATVLFATFVPLAAGIYLLTTTTWTLLERHYLHPAGTQGPPVERVHKLRRAPKPVESETNNSTRDSQRRDHA